MSLVRVTRVRIPEFSTIGYGYGEVEACGEPIIFAGDHRPMREIGWRIMRGEEVVVDVESWQVVKLGA